MGFAIILLPLFLGLGLAIGAVLLRAAVSLANKVLGPVAIPNSAGTGPAIAPPGIEPQTSQPNTPASGNPFAIQTESGALPSSQGTTPAGNPYATPAVASTSAIPSGPPTRTAIKEPGFGLAIGTVFVSGLVTGVLNFLIGFASREAGLDPLIGGVCSFLIGILITIAIYAGMLSTSFGKAALVYLFYVLIAVAIGIGIAAIVLGVGALFSLAG